MSVGARKRRPKAEATRKQLLLVSSGTHGPWSPVSYVRCLEVLGASEKTTIRILVRDATTRTPMFSYLHKGPGIKYLNVPRGEMAIRRVRGTEPITVVAYCGP